MKPARRYRNQSRSNRIPGVTRWSSTLAVKGALAISLLAGALPISSAEDLPKCLYISSYHKGYAWSDGVEEGVRQVLDGKCELRQFDMDTKRNKSKAYKEAAGLRARELIERWRPDVVITSDDNAAKYLIVPYYRDADVPFVFNGVNWTVDEYGFPFSNVTGIVEVAPIKPMLQEAMKIAGGSRGVYLGANTLTEEKNYSRIARGARRLNSELDKKLVSTFAEWKAAFELAHQQADYIVMGSNSGIAEWDDKDARGFSVEHAKVISVTNHKWMMDVTALGYTKIPQEHGQWAAEAGLAILDGTSPADIPIITNRKWDLWINQQLVDVTGESLSDRFTRKAKKLVMAED
jgi:ABC-type uncharacterized transport system substrate-binding protein